MLFMEYAYQTASVEEVEFFLKKNLIWKRLLLPSITLLSIRIPDDNKKVRF